MKKTGYDQFFKAASDAQKGMGPRTFKSSQKKPKKRELSEDEVEAKLRAALKVRAPKRRKPFPVMPMLTFVFVAAASSYGFANLDRIAKFTQRLQVSFIGQAGAEEKTAPPSDGKTAKTAATAGAQAASACPKPGDSVSKDTGYISTLRQRKEQLDARETELNQLEEELQRQKVEVDQRIGKLAQMRRDIASVLKERVQVDEQKVNKLVDLYSSMKPKQAADIIVGLDDDLAVQVLGGMKKKSAAAIMDVMPTEKAKVISEKLTGYQR